MIIVGLTGGIGHGKTTFAGLLAAQTTSSCHFESWEIVAEVGNALIGESNDHPDPADIEAINLWLLPLADITNFHMHCDISFEAIQLTDDRLARHPEHYAKLFEYLRLVRRQPELSQQTIDNDTKYIFRPLLQWLGGYLVSIKDGLWYDEILRRISLRKASGYLLVTVGGVRYPGDAERLRNAGGLIVNISRPTEPVQDSQDITERQRQLIEPDTTVINNGGLDELSSVAIKVYQDLAMRQLQPSYDCHQSAVSN